MVTANETSYGLPPPRKDSAQTSSFFVLNHLKVGEELQPLPLAGAGKQGW